MRWSHHRSARLWTTAVLRRLTTMLTAMRSTHLQDVFGKHLGRDRRTLTLSLVRKRSCLPIRHTLLLAPGVVGSSHPRLAAR